MKKMLIFFLLFVPFVSKADSGLDIRNQMLDSEIEKLTMQRDEKYADLQKCEKNTQGFKIAGITTLVATGIGVVGNIKLSEKLKGKNNRYVESARVVDNRPQEIKNDDSHNVLCDLDPETAKANGIQC